MRVRNYFKTLNGFTMTEVIMTLVIVSILGGVFYTMLITNWSSYEELMARAQLLNEANDIVEQISQEGRFTKTIDVVQDFASGIQTATLIDYQDQAIATYTMSSNGTLEIARPQANTVVLTNNLDFDNSAFTKNGKSLRMDLALIDDALMRKVSISTNTEIYPRN